MNWIDLHVHSNRSDGTCSPQELVEIAKAAGLAAFALTDHDTAKGVKEAVEAGKKNGILVLPGIEISVGYKGKDIHMLGLNVDPEHEALRNVLMDYHERRKNRNHDMVRVLSENGYDISMEALRSAFSGAVITRAHIARYLADTGQIHEMKEAFDKLIGEGCPYYIPKALPTIGEAISAILDAGGFPVLAHPMLYHMTSGELDEMVREMKSLGLYGIETIYSTNTLAEENDTRRLAKKYGLRISGGSDFHGSNKPKIKLGIGMGNLRVPEEIIKPFLKGSETVST